MTPGPRQFWSLVRGTLVLGPWKLGVGSWELGVAYLHRRIQQPEDALGRRHRALQDVELLGQVADGPEEALRVLQERDERSQREHVAAIGDDASPSHPENQRRRQRSDELDGRIEDGVVEDRLHVGVTMPAVDLVKGVEVTLLAPVQLNGRHAR